MLVRMFESEHASCQGARLVNSFAQADTCTRRCSCARGHAGELDQSCKLMPFLQNPRTVRGPTAAESLHTDTWTENAEATGCLHSRHREGVPTGRESSKRQQKRSYQQPRCVCVCEGACGFWCCVVFSVLLSACLVLHRLTETHIFMNVEL